MLNLARESNQTWVDRAIANLDVILLDHTHCEKKAASTAMNLIFRYQALAELMRPLSELAREELRHFELMLTVLQDRHIEFGPLDPSPYAKTLFTAVRHGEPERLIDTLLVCSLIEARSCERMRLLSEALPEGPIQKLYAGLLASEARHHRMYVGLVEQMHGRELAYARLAELAEHEAGVLQDLPDDPRMHN